MEIIDQIFWHAMSFVIGAVCGIFWILWLDRCKHDWNHLDILHKRYGFGNDKLSQVYVSQCKKCCKLKTQEVK